MLSNHAFTHRLIQTVVTVTAVAILITALWAARDALMLIYISALIAMGFSPLVRGIQRPREQDGRSRVPRALAIFVIYLAIIGTLIVVGLAVVPPLVAQARDLWAEAPGTFDDFQRFLIRYHLMTRRVTLQEAVRRLSGLPATNLGLDRRGFIRQGYFADVVVFDPKTIADKATYENPHQYAVGMKHVFVNGVQVLKDGEHAGAKPGRALWGPGKIR